MTRAPKADAALMLPSKCSWKDRQYSNHGSPSETAHAATSSSQQPAAGHNHSFLSFHILAYRCTPWHRCCPAPAHPASGKIHIHCILPSIS